MCGEVHYGEAYAPSSDGTPIYYFTQGPPGARAVLLSDGIGCHGYVWKYLTEALVRAGWRVIHWHYRGHGKTPAPADPTHVDLSYLVTDLFAVLDGANAAQAVLVGHSMGVQVVLEAQAKARARVQGLVLMSGSYGHLLRTFRGTRVLESALPTLRKMARHAPGMVRGLWRSLLPTELAFRAAQVIELNRELVRREDFFPYLEGIAEVDPLLFLDMLASASAHSAYALLPKIEAPTLVLAGDRDSFTPLELSRRMAALIPGAELVIIEGGSHTAAIERPEIVNHAVLDFLQRRVGAS